MALSFGTGLGGNETDASDHLRHQRVVGGLHARPADEPSRLLEARLLVPDVAECEKCTQVTRVVLEEALGDALGVRRRIRLVQAREGVGEEPPCVEVARILVGKDAQLAHGALGLPVAQQ
ncbi:MAG: hypothetical protein D6729_06530 [Deltaproteobacteria bacterium]|nr:MAG: hypothetical protein D6729_06530 [Deltaproteobacteria bacterium]